MARAGSRNPAATSSSRTFSLRFSLGSAFIGVVALTSLLYAVTTYPHIRSFVRDEIRERLRDAASIASLQISPELLAQLRDPGQEGSAAYKTVQRQLQEIRDHGTGIRYAYILRQGAAGQYLFVVDAEEKAKDHSHLGEVYDAPTPFMAAAFAPPYQVQVENRFFRDKWGNWLSSYAPILHPDGRLEGVLAIDLSADKVLEHERRYLLLLLAVACGVGLCVTWIGLRVSRRICQPLLLLEQDLARMQSLDLSADFHVHSRITEIISMEQAVNDMKNGLRSFKKYVPAELVSELISLHKEAVLEVEKKQLTVFFCDIKDFTSLSERLPPEELARLMGVYFDGMTKIILRHQGTVDKYIGDSIMAFWGAPHPCANQAVQACQAALECREFVTELAAHSRAQGREVFETRFGLNTGEAIVGNFGYAERFNYTAMGDSVNVASRLEGLNKEYGTTILISESTYLLAKHVIAARILDRVVVKGRSMGVTVFELIGAQGHLSADEYAALAQFNQGMEVFFSGHLTAAHDIFTDLAKKSPREPLTMMMLQRCRQGLFPDREPA